MRIEAHLERHYATTHNELVFGKLLVADEPQPYRVSLPSRFLPARLCDPLEFDRQVLVADFANLFERTWSPVTLDFARAIVTQSVDIKSDDQNEKPKRLVCLRHGSHCVAAIALLPKRGGAVKGLLLRATGHGSSLRTLVTAAADLATQLKGKKLYFLHPVLDSTVVGLLRSAGFQVEGLLRAPYGPGQDAIVMSKFL
jgi:hypothetical protein